MQRSSGATLDLRELAGEPTSWTQGRAVTVLSRGPVEGVAALDRPQHLGGVREFFVPAARTRQPTSGVELSRARLVGATVVEDGWFVELTFQELAIWEA